MAFTDFTSIAQVQETFHIKYMEEDYIQYNVDIEPSPAFLEELTFSQQHLEGNSDTTYKQELIKTLETAYRNATQHGTMNITVPNNKTMSFRMLFEESWRETVNETITDPY